MQPEVLTPCEYCGALHTSVCPRVERIEYFPSGTVKQVWLRETVAGPDDHTDHVELGHTCGSDCPFPSWSE